MNRGRGPSPLQGPSLRQWRATGLLGEGLTLSGRGGVTSPLLATPAIGRYTIGGSGGGGVVRHKWA